NWTVSTVQKLILTNNESIVSEFVIETDNQRALLMDFINKYYAELLSPHRNAEHVSSEGAVVHDGVRSLDAERLQARSRNAIAVGDILVRRPNVAVIEEAAEGKKEAVEVDGRRVTGNSVATLQAIQRL